MARLDLTEIVEIAATKVRPRLLKTIRDRTTLGWAPLWALRISWLIFAACALMQCVALILNIEGADLALAASSAVIAMLFRDLIFVRKLFGDGKR